MATSQSARFYLERERIIRSCAILEHEKEDMFIRVLVKSNWKSICKVMYKGKRHTKSAKRHLEALEQQVYGEYKNLQTVYQKHLKQIVTKPMLGGGADVLKAIVERFVHFTVQDETLSKESRLAKRRKACEGLIRARDISILKRIDSRARGEKMVSEIDREFLEALPKSIRQELLKDELHTRYHIMTQQRRRRKEAPRIVLTSGAIKMTPREITLIMKAAAKKNASKKFIGRYSTGKSVSETHKLSKKTPNTRTGRQTATLLLLHNHHHACTTISTAPATIREITIISQNIISLKSDIANIARDLESVGYAVPEMQKLSAVPARMREQLEGTDVRQFFARANAPCEESWTVKKGSGLRQECANARKIEKRMSREWRKQGLKRFLGEGVEDNDEKKEENGDGGVNMKADRVRVVGEVEFGEL